MPWLHSPFWQSFPGILLVLAALIASVWAVQYLISGIPLAASKILQRPQGFFLIGTGLFTAGFLALMVATFVHAD
jgi:hypothetical protein